MSFHQYSKFQPSEFNHTTWSIPIHLPYAFQFRDLMKALSKYQIRQMPLDTSDIKKILDTYFSPSNSRDEQSAWETILLAASDYDLDDKVDAFYIPEVESPYTVEDVFKGVKKLLDIVNYIEQTEPSVKLLHIRKSLLVAQKVLENYTSRL